MIDPTVRCFGEIKIGEDSYVGPFTVLGFPLKTPIGVDNINSRGVQIGKSTGILTNVVVGEGTVIGDNVWIDHHCSIGCDSFISNNSYVLYGAKIFDRVKIDEGCWIAGFMCNDSIVEKGSIVMGSLVHRFVNAVAGVPEASPVIREKAFIGMNAIIIGGIEVGIGAYIGAGSVLTKSARPGRLYLGIPAKDAGPASSTI